MYELESPKDLVMTAYWSGFTFGWVMGLFIGFVLLVIDRYKRENN